MSISSTVTTTQLETSFSKPTGQVIVTTTGSPGINLTNPFVFIPLVLLTGLFLLCVVSRIIPFFQFKFQKPIITQSNDPVEVAYRADEGYESDTSTSTSFHDRNRRISLQQLDSQPQSTPEQEDIIRPYSIPNRPSNLRLSMTPSSVIPATGDSVVFVVDNGIISTPISAAEPDLVIRHARSSLPLTEQESRTIRAVRSFVTSNAVVTVGNPPEYELSNSL
ncbi:hypothetical protein BC833DRAFT_618755 [Globomyces pollinis-pini]|nr:hypothetical protein BC833DRAFT_618755 [Globomyces pollinis-pini]